MIYRPCSMGRRFRVFLDFVRHSACCSSFELSRRAHRISFSESPLVLGAYVTCPEWMERLAPSGVYYSHRGGCCAACLNIESRECSKIKLRGQVLSHSCSRRLLSADRPDPTEHIGACISLSARRGTRRFSSQSSAGFFLSYSRLPRISAGRTSDDAIAAPTRSGSFVDGHREERFAPRTSYPECRSQNERTRPCLKSSEADVNERA